MGIKLRNFSRNTITKFIAFLIVIAMVVLAVIQLFYVDWNRFDIEPLMVETYEESNTFMNELVNTFSEVDLHFNDREILEIEDLNYIYYITDGKETQSNREDFSREDFLNYSNHVYEYKEGRVTSDGKVYENFTYLFGEGVTIYIGFPDEYMKDKQEEWNVAGDTLDIQVIEFAVYFIVALVLIVYLVTVTGRKPNKEALQINWLDALYSEILLALIVLPVIICCIYLTDLHYYYNYVLQITTVHKFYLYLIGTIAAIGTLLSGAGLLALVRKLKDRRFLKGFLLYKIIDKIVDFLKGFIDGRRYAKYPLTRNLHRRQLAFIIASFILVFFTVMFIFGLPPLAIIPPALEMVLIYWYVKYNNKTYDEINKGFNESLEEQMKSERMKIELVTNVSHDLKTPLTSIISYVDLLSKEENLSETARDYIKVLSEKSDRLKHIVSDLFDLAKSSSGDINLHLEAIDMKTLIEQILGDIEDDIEKAGHKIKMKLPDSSVEIVADSNKLYRVIQNVLDNALKYSLNGTRIFIEMEKREGRGIITIKNTASYEIDFTAEEILQRFNRGDKARTADGSGLGLSIAESFTNVSGGDFKVDIDGDTFKVIISFPLASE
ncbi:sensor histidine kinase [Oceanobacillus neutriphilus]|uniref:histidine kinase n=1 Tax=Oceanobacillus neutriphilus TaxID=531815 RepID=A0ABQ2NPK6_9BACI|nr:HAMP domain-containing sensor histidine kinase [Oceanobacillus neutriphilus]GGP08578.1 hypothetical protein GCM10011346_09180 [Oceanobacillus neutriphilus]